jgi:hypothetical protein
MLRLAPEHLRAPKGLSRAFVRKYDGPYEIVVKVGRVAYKFQLPKHIQQHPVFHVSQLKPYHYMVWRPPVTSQAGLQQM